MKPFLKWVGGKTQILEEVIADFPAEIVNYYEPFLGGGSVLLGLLAAVQEGRINVKGKIYTSDLNVNLISLYKNIQSKSEEVISEVKRLHAEFRKIKGETVNRKASTMEEALSSPESYYFWIRSCFNQMKGAEKETVTASARFLFLNKTCFRGLYREGPNGFNVPFGNYKNPSIIEEEHIRAVSALIQGVVFNVGSFTETLKGVKEGDFVYLDPPYAPENDKSFVSYTADGFSLENHKELFLQCKTIGNVGGSFLMSNADVKLVKDAFPEEEGYITKIVVCRRAINSKNPEAKTNEVLITKLRDN